MGKILLLHQYCFLRRMIGISIVLSPTTRLNNNKIAMDDIGLEKKVQKLLIEKIGAMKNVEDFTSPMVNTITMSTAAVDYKEITRLGSPSVIHQVAKKFNDYELSRLGQMCQGHWRWRILALLHLPIL